MKIIIANKKGILQERKYPKSMLDLLKIKKDNDFGD